LEGYHETTGGTVSTRRAHEKSKSEHAGNRQMKRGSCRDGITYQRTLESSTTRPGSCMIFYATHKIEHHLLTPAPSSCLSFYSIEVKDISLVDYINVQHAVYVPHTAGRYAKKQFAKGRMPIVERLVNSLMMNGRNNGKKLLAVRIVAHAFEIIHLLTDQNPIQVSGVV
jgi:hypothetical protein